MRTAKEIFDDELSGEPLTHYAVIDAIQLAQFEAIEEACLECAKIGIISSNECNLIILKLKNKLYDNT